MDNYYLNEAVYLLDEFMAKTESPHYAGRFEYGDRGRHGWSPYKSNAEMYREMAAHIARNAPSGDNQEAWHYK